MWRLTVIYKDLRPSIIKQFTDFDFVLIWLNRNNITLDESAVIITITKI